MRHACFRIVHAMFTRPHKSELCRQHALHLDTHSLSHHDYFQTRSGKGHAGAKPCLLCVTACDHKPQFGAAPLSVTQPHLFVSVATPRLSAFTAHTNDSLRDVITRLNNARPNLNATRFAEMQKLYGFTWTPSSIMHHPLRIDVADGVMWDWAHTYLCGGIGDNEFGLVMKSLHVQRSDTTWADLAEYIQSWILPKQYGVSGTSASSMQQRLFASS